MATPAKHALLSASAAHRWLKCTAAPTYEMQFPPKTSEYAEEGTLAHSICELYARKKFTVMSTRKFNSELKKLQEHPLYKPEMLTTAESYVLYLYGVCMRYEGMPHVNMEVRVDLSDYVPQGFGTCDCIIIGGDTLHITDYKHGQGVVVEAEGNPQMMLYALGALKRYTPVFGDKIKRPWMSFWHGEKTWSSLRRKRLSTARASSAQVRTVNSAAGATFAQHGQSSIPPWRILRIASRRIRRRIRSTPLHAKCWDCRPF